MNKEQVENKKNDWGLLTAEKPTVFARDLIKNGVDLSLIKEYLIKHYKVSEKNANLVYQTLKNQKTIIKNDKLVNLFIDFENFEKNEVEKFFSILKRQIEKMKQLIYKKAYVVRSIFISADMLEVLTEKKMETLLSELTYPVSELIVEVENFDKVTEEKLLHLKNHKVTKLVFKVKTFVVKTLKTFKNKPTNAQFFKAYMLALKHNFIVEIKLIAGLEDETLTNFKKTISIALEVSPHNITIQTRPSILTANMINFALDIFKKTDYKPYFFSKDTKGDLSELGFTIKGKAGLYNIDKTDGILKLLTCQVEKD